MSKKLQRDPFSSLVRAINLLLQGRIHFPKERLGEIVDEGEEFEISVTVRNVAGLFGGQFELRFFNNITRQYSQAVLLAFSL